MNRPRTPMERLIDEACGIDPSAPAPPPPKHPLSQTTDAQVKVFMECMDAALKWSRRAVRPETSRGAPRRMQGREEGRVDVNWSTNAYRALPCPVCEERRTGWLVAKYSLLEIFTVAITVSALLLGGMIYVFESDVVLHFAERTVQKNLCAKACARNWLYADNATGGDLVRCECEGRDK